MFISRNSADSRLACTLSACFSRHDHKQADFLEFVLSQYVAEGEEELGSDKLPDLLTLKYGSPADALRSLGKVEDVRRAFRGFQEELYRRD